MSAIDPDSIRQAVLEVLEQFAMMLGDMDERLQAIPSKPAYYRVNIHIKGPSSMTLSLIAPHMLCESLASNALGLDGTIHVDTAQDVLKELANITAGKLALSLFGDANAIPLTIPALTVLTPADWEHIHQSSSTMSFNVEGNPFLVVLNPD
jgi:hypothetical protein